MKITFKWVLLALCCAVFFYPIGHAISAEKFLTLTSGSTGGTYYILGGGIANLLSTKLGGIQVTCEVSGGSIENVRRLNAQENDLGWVESSIAYLAFNGLKKFEKHPNIGGITMAYSNVFQLFALKKSNIRTLRDLKGKRVAVGPPGGSTEITIVDIVTAYGMSYKDITPRYISRGDAVAALRDGNVDAVFTASGIPTAIVIDISSTHDIFLIPIDDKEALAKLPSYFRTATIPGGMYKGVNINVPTVDVPAILLAKRSMSEDLAYRITKTIFENLGFLVSIHPAAKEITLQKALSGMVIPLHPGAAKYFREKGLKINQ